MKYRITIELEYTFDAKELKEDLGLAAAESLDAETVGGIFADFLPEVTVGDIVATSLTAKKL